MWLAGYLAYKERVEERVADEGVDDRIDAEPRAEIVPISSVATSRRYSSASLSCEGEKGRAEGVPCAPLVVRINPPAEARPVAPEHHRRRKAKDRRTVSTVSRHPSYHVVPILSTVAHGGGDRRLAERPREDDARPEEHRHHLDRRDHLITRDRNLAPISRRSRRCISALYLGAASRRCFSAPHLVP